MAQDAVVANCRNAGATKLGG